MLRLIVQAWELVNLQMENTAAEFQSPIELDEHPSYVTKLTKAVVFCLFLEHLKTLRPVNNETQNRIRRQSGRIRGRLAPASSAQPAG